MFLSEAETEARLDDLRRQRAALDRAIAEHELYLDLGRRLARPGAAAAASAPTAPVEPTRPDPAPPSRSEPPRTQPVMQSAAKPTLAPAQPQADPPEPP
ncbi:hypothetical protein CS379_25440, partial [Methylobacterium frigidaeris]